MMNAESSFSPQCSRTVGVMTLSVPAVSHGGQESRKNQPLPVKLLKASLPQTGLFTNRMLALLHESALIESPAIESDASLLKCFSLL